MPTYTYLIRAHADRLNTLLWAVHHTYGQRNQSAEARQEREQAYQVFRSYQSTASDLLERAERGMPAVHRLEATRNLA